jgi:hypothetical protein
MTYAAKKPVGKNETRCGRSWKHRVEIIYDKMRYIVASEKVNSVFRYKHVNDPIVNSFRIKYLSVTGL